MSYKLTPVTAETVPIWVDTMTTSFYSSPQPFLGSFYPEGFTPEIRSWQISRHQHALKTSPSTDHYFLIQQSTDDKHDDEILGVTHWELHLTPQTAQDRDAEVHKARQSRAEMAKQVSGVNWDAIGTFREACLLYTSPSPRDGLLSRMPSSA